MKVRLLAVLATAASLAALLGDFPWGH